jgi:hypothetical protein
MNTSLLTRAVWLRVGFAGVVATTAATLLGGCSTRRLIVTSEPSGATVVVNDIELGATPLEADFQWYGTFDVRVSKAGYEPLCTKAEARPPIYEVAPLDLATAAVPGADAKVRWHFTLKPVLESTLSEDDLSRQLIDRAQELRAGVREP